MDAALLGLLAILVLVAVAGLAFVKLQGSGDASTRGAGAEDDMDVADVGQNRAARRRGARGRMGAADLRHRHQQAQHAAVPLRRVDDGTSSSATGSDESDDEGGQGRRPGKKNKKDRKRADRQARQEAREEAAEARRQEEERRAMPSAYEERMRKRDAEREAREQAQEEEIRRAAEEKQRLEDEEAARWMGQISVQEEGTGADEESDDTSGLLGQFVDYIMARKTVPLEQIATDFKLRTTDVIDRIHRLEEMGRLTGVMDDRGKYIYISLPEMECVAKFLTERGRVSIAELAAKSSTLIDLEPKAATATTLHMGAGIDFDSVLAT